MVPQKSGNHTVDQHGRTSIVEPRLARSENTSRPRRRRKTITTTDGSFRSMISDRLQRGMTHPRCFLWLNVTRYHNSNMAATGKSVNRVGQEMHGWHAQPSTWLVRAPSRPVTPALVTLYTLAV